MKLRWTKQMSVGNELMDAEHKTLLGMVNHIEDAISAKDPAALLDSFSLFANSVRAHFRDEAKLAQAIDYPFDDHVREHQYVLKELEAMKNEIAARKGKWSESAAEHYLGFLSAWSTAHIDEDDMKMKPLLVTLPYDFKP